MDLKIVANARDMLEMYMQDAEKQR